VCRPVRLHALASLVAQAEQLLPRPSMTPATRNSPGPRSANFSTPPLPQRHAATGTAMINLTRITDIMPMSGRGSAARIRRQETDGGQRCLRHSSHVANPAGGSSTGSLPSSSPAVGISMLAAHSASSSSDIGQVAYGAAAVRHGGERGVCARSPLRDDSKALIAQPMRPTRLAPVGEQGTQRATAPREQRLHSQATGRGWLGRSADLRRRHGLRPVAALVCGDPRPSSG
jgi:hypothetical protein